MKLPALLLLPFSALVLRLETILVILLEINTSKSPLCIWICGGMLM